MEREGEPDGYDPVAAGEQAKDSTDLFGIRHNLTLAERIAQHESAMKSVLCLRGL